MQETRRARLQSVIQEEVSAMIQREIKDPRVPAFVTITSVEVNPEGDHAILYVSTLGSDQGGPDGEGERALMDCVQGLVSATPFFRRHLAKILSVRHIPNLAFRPDYGLANAQRVGELLEHLKKEPRPSPEDSADKNASDVSVSDDVSGTIPIDSAKKSKPAKPVPGERMSKYRAKLLAKAESESTTDSESDSDRESE